jgi:hypothetical protein
VNDAPPSHLAQSPDAPRTQSSPGLPARRKLDNLAWALGALTLGWLAQGLYARERLWEGTLLYAVAIPLFAVQITRGGGAREKVSVRQGAAPEHRTSLSHAAALRRVIGLGLITASLVLSFVSLDLFTLETQNLIAWYLYLIYLVVFVVGIWLTEPQVVDRVATKRGTGNRGTTTGESAMRDGPVSDSSMPSVPDSFTTRFSISPPSLTGSLILLILLLAFFFRTFHFFSLPFGTWFDEAEAGIQARRILIDPTFRPVFWEHLNLPAHLLYLFSFSFRLFGVNTPALRVIPVLFGIGGVLFAYLFGQEWKGRRWGLLLAFLAATMRWHVNFSRIAMTGVDTPFFEFAVLYFGLRALRTGRMRPAAWAGLCLGLGLSFYAAFRLFVGATLVLAVGWGLGALARRLPVLREGRGRRGLTESGEISGEPLRTARQVVLHLVLILVAVWLAVMPVAQFAWRHGDVFWFRTRTVSIFESRDEPNLGRALAENTRKHLLMFNYQGDVNGRHNLPGAPMLDRLSAVLFAMGLGVAIARRDTGSKLFLLLLLVGLAGGIFTLDFEAPQSLRSMAALPAVVYLVALSLDALWLELKWAACIDQPRYSLIPVVIGLGFIAVSNGVVYFGPQANDFGVWRSFSTAETLVGKRMSELGEDPIYYLSPFFFDHPSIRFHAPAAEESPPTLRQAMPLPDPLPARVPADRPVVYFIHPDEAWVFDLGRQVYLTGSFETLPSDSEFPPVVYVLRLGPEDVASVQGLDLRYWAGEDWEGAGIPVGIPVITSRSAVIDVSWLDERPLRAGVWPVCLERGCTGPGGPDSGRRSDGGGGSS